MSKVSRRTEKAMSADFLDTTEAVGTSEMILSGRRSMSRLEAEKLFAEAGDMLDIQFKRLDHNMKALAFAEIEVADKAKILMRQSKDIAGQVGDALSRIDKVVVKDFDAKLCQLERFTKAMKELDDLQKSGRLQSILAAFSK